MDMEKFLGIAKNMIGYVLIHGNNIGHNRPLQDAVAIISKPYQHNGRFIAAQWF